MRAAVIISNDAAKTHPNRGQVVPLTFRVDRVYPSATLVQMKGKQRKAMADQLTTVSKRRLFEREGRWSAADMERIERAVLVQLGLSRSSW